MPQKKELIKVTKVFSKNQNKYYYYALVLFDNDFKPSVEKISIDVNAYEKLSKSVVSLKDLTLNILPTVNFYDGKQRTGFELVNI